MHVGIRIGKRRFVRTCVSCGTKHTVLSSSETEFFLFQYIILAMHARPVPLDPYNPSPQVTNSTDNETIRHPSPLVPIRLPIFALVMWLNDSIIKALSVGGGSTKASGPRGSRAFSDPTESIEEGSTSAIPLRTVRPASGRINIGRRKID